MNAETYESIVRDLTAYGDTIGESAFYLVWKMSTCSLPTEQAAKVRTIIETHTEPGITDSLLDDLLDEMDAEKDDENWNE